MLGECMTLQEYVGTLKRHWILILVLAVVGGGVAYLYSQTVEPKYRSQTDVMVMSTHGENTAELAQGASYVRSLVETYTLLVQSPEVLTPVIDDLGLKMTPQQLASSMDVNAPLDTLVIQIGVTDGDPAEARRTADAIAAQLAKTVPEVSPAATEDSQSVQVTTISPASMPRSPVSPNTRLNVLIGTAIGLFLGVVISIFRRRFLSRIGAPEDIAGLTDVGVLGEIPVVGGKQTLVRAARNSPQGRVAESLRQLAASLRFTDLGGSRRVILVTSGSAMEGKSSVSLGLALTLAEAGHSALYVEADLRRPNAAGLTGLETSIGVTDVLVGDATIGEAVQEWGHANLSVLACGTRPPNPGQILASQELGELVSEARKLYDYVIVDSPPVLAVSDALWLSASVDGTLVVVRSGSTTAAELRRTLAALERAGSPVTGIVIDRAKSRHRSPYYVEYPPQPTPTE